MSGCWFAVDERTVPPGAARRDDATFDDSSSRQVTDACDYGRRGGNDFLE